MVQQFIGTADARLDTAALSDEVARRLRREIFSGFYEGGETLKQLHVAERLGISAVPVREAFQRLIAEGLLVSQRNRGVVVARLSKTDIVDIAELRILLEPQAMRLSAPNLTPADLAEATQLLKRADKTTDAVARSERHWAFHRLLYSRADRPAAAGDDRQALSVDQPVSAERLDDCRPVAGLAREPRRRSRLPARATVRRCRRDDPRAGRRGIRPRHRLPRGRRPFNRKASLMDFDRFELVTFDCYGTLIDWESGITNFVRPFLAQLPSPVPPDLVLSAFALMQANHQQVRPTLLYREVLRRTWHDVEATFAGRRIRRAPIHSAARCRPGRPFPTRSRRSESWPAGTSSPSCRTSITGR
ncbi:MAG: GntR family transcriptional regulator [Pseudomonadota bacterium]